MKNLNLKDLELICKKCYGIRNKIPVETLPEKIQLAFKEIQEDIPGIKLVFCQKCDEISFVTEYQLF
jgi:hypothetical protein